MLRWAILGTSFISDTMARAVANSPGSTATVVAGRDQSKTDSFARRHGIAHALTSMADAVARNDVDAVYVGTPNHVHHVAVVAAANAGKSILSEKSLTVTMDQAEVLLGAVRGRVFFVEGLMYLAHPLMARLRDVIASGELGTIRALHASYGANIAHLVNPEGKGSIYNLGCYPASLVQLVVDTAFGDGSFDGRDIAATGRRGVDNNIVETAASVRFECGPLATVHTSELYGNTARFEVHGERGSLTAIANPWLPQPGRNALRLDRFGAASIEIDINGPLDAFDHQVRMVERCVAEGRLEAERPSPRLADSYALLRFLTEWETKAGHE